MSPAAASAAMPRVPQTAPVWMIKADHANHW